MKEREFIDIGSYPQFSLQAEGGWSDRIVGGVGCNFFLGRKGNLPPFSDKRKWRKIDSFLRDLKIGMLRIGFLPSGSGDVAGDAASISPWDDRLQNYDFKNDFFKVLKYLDTLAGELKFPIMIDPWWIPRSMQIEQPGESGTSHRGAPSDLNLYAEKYVMPLVTHSVDKLKCKNIKYLGLLNEPVWNQDDRNPGNFTVKEGDDQLKVLSEMYSEVRNSLDSAGFTQIKIIGPSALCAYQFPMSDFLASGVDPTPYLGALDHHYYMYHLDSASPPNDEFFSTHETVDGNIRRWCDFAKRKKLPFMITEMGSFAYGRLFWGEKDMEGPASHTCAVSDAQFIVRSLARGVQSFLRWTFSVPEHFDGRWSIVEWNEKDVYPTPNIYPMYRELMRSIRPGCQVMKVKVGYSAGRRSPVHAVATKYGSEINLLIVNDEPGKNHDVIVGNGPWSGMTFNRIIVDETRKGSRIQPVKFPSDPAKGAEFVLTPYSLTVLTNRKG
jgi:hypothetical protein